MILKKIILSIFLLLKFFYSHNIYISDSSKCQNLCDGSKINPYSGLINGYSQIYNKIKSNKISDNVIHVILLSKSYSIIEDDLKKVSGVLNNSNGGKFGIFFHSKFIYTYPFGCNYIDSCKIVAKIHIKTTIFFFAINSSFIFNSLEFHGNDINLNYKSILDLNCLKNSCCSFNDLNGNSIRCNIFKKKVNRSENHTEILPLFVIFDKNAVLKFQTLNFY